MNETSCSLSDEEISKIVPITFPRNILEAHERLVKVNQPNLSLESIHIAAWKEYYRSLGPDHLFGVVKRAMNKRGFMLAMSDLDLETGSCSVEFFKTYDEPSRLELADDSLSAIVRAALKVV